MTSTKKVKLHPEDKILLMLYSGKECTKAEIESKLGNEITMNRISAYLWKLKVEAYAIIRPTKVGKSVSGYTLLNPKDMNLYFKLRNIPIPKFVKDDNYESNIEKQIPSTL